LGKGLGDRFGGLFLVNVGIEDGFNANAGALEANIVIGRER
jgi:hypothetical protein